MSRVYALRNLKLTGISPQYAIVAWDQLVARARFQVNGTQLELTGSDYQIQGFEPIEMVKLHTRVAAAKALKIGLNQMTPPRRKIPNKIPMAHFFGQHTLRLLVCCALQPEELVCLLYTHQNTVIVIQKVKITNQLQSKYAWKTSKNCTIARFLQTVGSFQTSRIQQINLSLYENNCRVLQWICKVARIFHRLS